MFSGAGPGAQTADGCSVELYRRLTHVDDLEPVRGFLSQRATVLELGCGAGRHTRALLQWGLRPTCVDNSPDMLAELPSEATTVLSSIETLALNQHFDAALLASCLINHPSAQVRRLFVGAAARHLKTGSVLLVQRHDPHWLRSAQAGWSGRAGAVSVTLQSVEREGTLNHMALCYAASEGKWVHRFTAEALDEAEVEAILFEAGFWSCSWTGPHLTWIAARAK